MKRGQSNAAVEVESNGCTARLELSYKTIDRLGRERSDSEVFSANFPGKRHATQAMAVEAILEAARQWAAYRRLEGYEVSAWDSARNTY
jgi:hypothetical protein